MSSYRRVILLFLKTGAVKLLILHYCHMVDGIAAYVEPQFYAENRRKAFNEIQDIVDELGNPLDIEFLVDTTGKLSPY